MSASVFPARAGMSPVVEAWFKVGVRVPRASGDEPKCLDAARICWECSPRERG